MEAIWGVCGFVNRRDSIASLGAGVCACDLQRGGERKKERARESPRQIVREVEEEEKEEEEQEARAFCIRRA